ncbi:MAG: MFS transporter [Acidimicrobiia bacterium]|nr:MFS transporter [Acidimicrobiia bacterium]
MSNQPTFDSPSNVIDGGHPQRWTVLWILCGSLVLVVVSVSSLNVAIPQIQASLAASGSDMQWIIDSYALVFAGLLLPAGAIGDRYGRREALLFGLVVFGIAAVGGMLASNPEQLIAWRGAMGAGAAFIMPATLSIVATVFGPAERPKAIAIWAGFAGAGGVVGLISSGLLLRSFWWGSVFAVNIPLVVMMAIAVALFVPTSRDPEATRLDPVGAGLSIIGLVALVFGIIEGPEKGWSSTETVSAFAIAAISLTAFVLWELRSDHPMLDPRFFRKRRFSLGALTITATFFGVFAMFFVITQFLQFVQEYDALEAGVRILPYALVLLVVSPKAADLAARFGDRAVMVIGMAIGAIGFVVLGMLEPDSSYWLTAVGLVVVALGTGLLMPPATTALVASLPAAKAGVGSAMNDTTREVGGAIGIAVGGALLSIGYRSGIDDSLGSLDPETAEAAADSLGALLLDPDARHLADIGRDAFTDGMQLAMFTSAALLVAAAVAVAVLHPPDASGDSPAQASTDSGDRQAQP